MESINITPNIEESVKLNKYYSNVHVLNYSFHKIPNACLYTIRNANLKFVYMNNNIKFIKPLLPQNKTMINHTQEILIFEHCDYVDK